MNRILVWSIVLTAGIGIAACDISDPETVDNDFSAVIATTPITTTGEVAPRSASPSATSTAAPSSDIVPMPDVTCMNLQDAQDRIQDAGVFFSRSVDATGAGRNQIMDRNWVVVSQEPGPGTRIGERDAVLSVVKYGEPGDCS